MSKLLAVVLGYFSELVAGARIHGESFRPSAEVMEQIDLYLDGGITAVNQNWAAPIFEKIIAAVGDLTDQTDAMPSNRAFLALVCRGCEIPMGNVEVATLDDPEGKKPFRVFQWMGSTVRLSAGFNTTVEL